MYTDNTQNNLNNWNEIRSKIKARFSKLSDESIDSLKGDLGQLSSKLQSAYGYPQDQADREAKSFNASQNSNRDDSNRDSSNRDGSGRTAAISPPYSAQGRKPETLSGKTPKESDQSKAV